MTRPPGREQVLHLLQQTPVRLLTVAPGVPDERLARPPADGGWSPTEVLAHLRHCADVWGASIARVLDEDHPTIRAVSPRTYAQETTYGEEAFSASLEAFVAQRTALLARLEALSPPDWERAAHVVGAGAPLETSVLQYATRMATHERAHVKQVQRALRDASG